MTRGIIEKKYSVKNNNVLYSNLYNKGKLMLLHSLLFTTFFSCSKKDFQDFISFPKGRREKC